MRTKQINDAAAYIRGLAAMRGRNADWAEKAVREAVSLPAAEARKLKVIDVVARDVPDLLKQLDGRKVSAAGAERTLATAGAALTEIEADWRTRLLMVITDPSIAVILMMIGIYGLIFEFMNPGFVLPGVLGGICLLVALYAFQLLPINYAGIALILLGVAFIVAEAFMPSFGALGIGGTCRARDRHGDPDRPRRRARIRHSAAVHRGLHRDDGARRFRDRVVRAEGAQAARRQRTRGSRGRRRRGAGRFRGRRLGARARRDVAREKRRAAQAGRPRARHWRYLA